MIIDKLNTLMGNKTSHIIQNTTNALYTATTFTDGLILLTDSPYKLYKQTSGTKTAVAEPTNTDVINAIINMIRPDNYVGVMVNGVIDNTWPPIITNSQSYVCDSFTTLLGLTGIKKGEIAVVGDYAYLLITDGYQHQTNWIQLKSKITDYTLISGLDKVHVGLPNVDNTSDLSKPISTATQTALTALQTQITALQASVTTMQTQISAINTRLGI